MQKKHCSLQTRSLDMQGVLYFRDICNIRTFLTRLYARCMWEIVSYLRKPHADSQNKDIFKALLAIMLLFWLMFIHHLRAAEKTHTCHCLFINSLYIFSCVVSKISFLFTTLFLLPDSFSWRATCVKLRHCAAESGQAPAPGARTQPCSVR